VQKGRESNDSAPSFFVSGVGWDAAGRHGYEQRAEATMAKTDFKPVDDYIAAQPKNVQVALRRVRSIIRKAVRDVWMTSTMPGCVDSRCCARP
jgi:hypothetical protein